MIILMRIDFMLRPVITDSEEERGGEEGEQRSTKFIKSLCSIIRKGAGDSEIIPTFVDTAIPYQNIIEVGNSRILGQHIEFGWIRRPTSSYCISRHG